MKSLYWKICATFVAVVFVSLLAGGTTFRYTLHVLIDRQMRTDRRGFPAGPHARVQDLIRHLARSTARELEAGFQAGGSQERAVNLLEARFADPRGTQARYIPPGQSVPASRPGPRRRPRKPGGPGFGGGPRGPPPRTQVTAPIGPQGQYGHVLIQEPPWPRPPDGDWESFTVKLLQAGALSFLVVLLISCLVGALSFRYLISEVDKLHTCILGVAGGNLSLRVPNPRIDEIGRLGEAFNRMAARLQEVVGELEAVDEKRRRFLLDIAHELRTPMSTIRSSFEQILDAPHDLPGEGDARIRLGFEEIERLGLLIEDLLEMARLESPRYELHREDEILQRVVARCVNRFSVAIANRNLRVATHFSPEPLEVRIDRRRFEQIVSNLIQNAIHALDDGGTIDVTVDAHEGVPTIVIEDNGPGIPEDQCEQVFERFYTSSGCRGGTGLGLSIVKQLVDAHGGTIQLESDSGRGTRFTIRLSPED